MCGGHSASHLGRGCTPMGSDGEPLLSPMVALSSQGAGLLWPERVSPQRLQCPGVGGSLTEGKWRPGPVPAGLPSEGGWWGWLGEGAGVGEQR